jgi:hypothetical protein
LIAKNRGHRSGRCSRSSPRQAGAWLAGLALFFLAPGCAGGKTAPPRTIPPASQSAIAPAIPPATTPPWVYNLEIQLRSRINLWLGTPYKRGGTSRRGIDCSGFVQQIVRDLFAIELPRTSGEQARCGEAVGPSELQPGDLLVFTIRGVRNHMAIYLGDGEFAHASPRRGITIASLREPHWSRAFRSARRLKSG